MKSKQELVEKWESAIEAAEFYGKGKEGKLISYMEDFVSDLNQLDEPEKIVIPQFVADWWERDGDLVTMYGGLRVKKKHKFDLVSYYHDRGLADYLSEAEEWIEENKSAFLDLVNGKPYEVEEEKKYNVKLKVKSSFGTLGIFLYKEGDEILAGDNFDVYRPKDDNFRLTEQEIKDYDERFWPFAVEVAE